MIKGIQEMRFLKRAGYRPVMWKGVTFGEFNGK